MFLEMLRDEGIPAFICDRFRFREMLDASHGSEFWPSGVVAILSREFARQQDVLDSLTNAHWNLLLADEAHWFKGSRAQFLLRVGATAERVVLAAATNIASADVFPLHDATVVDWRRDLLVDQEGRLLDVVPRADLHEIPFTLNQPERSLLQTVRALSQVLEAGTPQQEWVAKSLLASLQSSPAALEGALRRFVARSEKRAYADDLIGVTEDGLAEDMLNGRMDPATAEKARAIAERALQEVEALQGDSKLSAFGGAVSQLNGGMAPVSSICVLTDYLATLYYLSAEIEGRGWNYRLLHGGMSSTDRYESLGIFSDAGGILVATRAVMTEGVSLRDVTDLVLYDLPGSEVALREVLGRFDRVGRRTQLHIRALIAPVAASGPTPEPLHLLRELLGSGPRT